MSVSNLQPNTARNLNQWSLNVISRESTRAAGGEAKVVRLARGAVMQWVLGFAEVLSVIAGWQIDNAARLFHGFTWASAIMLGGWIGYVVLWHFGALWV